MKVSDYFEQKENFNKLIKEFFNYLCQNELDIYNEFSFQHELGYYLRSTLRKDCIDGIDFKIEFERNAEKHFHINYSSISNEELKKEIDIAIYKPNHSVQYAIELKYPLNRQYPEQMFNFIKDIRFMQELVNQKKFQRTYCLTLVWASGRGRPFYKGSHLGTTGIDIYKYFREDKELITGQISKPTGLPKHTINLKEKEYPFSWEDCQIINSNTKNIRYKYRKCKYYIIECK